MMSAAFGANIMGANVFASNELPHGATMSGAQVFFVIHAPHAVKASLILVDEGAPGGPARQLLPMQMTTDIRYWWIAAPSAQAPAGARYRFLLNDDSEVLDPAAKSVQDGGNFDTKFGENPADPSTSWSILLDSGALMSVAWKAPWRTMTWDALLFYEIHPSRFTDISPGALIGLELLTDELKSTNRLGKPGYLTILPATALQIMPISEFEGAASWGYNPALFFAIDSYYGGASALAELVAAAHSAGKAVFLDLVYNHMDDSPLMMIAPDVYSNGGTPWGPAINNGAPMVLEFFRQATVYLWRTFGLDGFRFDSTTTIVQNQGWNFLGALRSAVRAAASAEGRGWPYLVGENDPKYWDITNPAWSILDGEWDTTELYCLGDSVYDLWPANAANNRASDLKACMDAPISMGRSFSEATRYGESHDSVSGQGDWNKRIAFRPPFGLGLQAAKAVGVTVMLSNGVPMIFMGEEVGETNYFSYDNTSQAVNPQLHDLPAAAANDNARVLAWFRLLAGLRNDPAKGLRGDSTVQSVAIGNRTVGFTCGYNRQIFVVCTFGTPDLRQDSSWLGLPAGIAYKEIFNSTWPAYNTASEAAVDNGGYNARIYSGAIFSLPYVGAVVLEKA